MSYEKCGRSFPFAQRQQIAHRIYVAVQRVMRLDDTKCRCPFIDGEVTRNSAVDPEPLGFARAPFGGKSAFRTFPLERHQFKRACTQRHRMGRHRFSRHPFGHVDQGQCAVDQPLPGMLAQLSAGGKQRPSDPRRLPCFETTRDTMPNDGGHRPENDWRALNMADQSTALNAVEECAHHRRLGRIHRPRSRRLEWCTGRHGRRISALRLSLKRRIAPRGHDRAFANQRSQQPQHSPKRERLLGRGDAYCAATDRRVGEIGTRMPNSFVCHRREGSDCADGSQHGGADARETLRGRAGNTPTAAITLKPVDYHSSTGSVDEKCR